MKYFIINLIVFIIFLSSCNKEEKESPCEYNFFEGIDTSLYVSFEINNEQLVYYQKMTGNGGRSLHFDSTTNTEIWHYATLAEFDISEPDSFNNFFRSPVDLVFFDFSINNRIHDYFLLSKYLEDNINFKHYSAQQRIDFMDTIFMKGVSMRYYNYSTETVIDYFNYDLDSINDFYANNSFFNVTSRTQVCENKHLIQGNFSTKIMYNSSPYSVINIENGKFNFLIY